MPKSKLLSRRKDPLVKGIDIGTKTKERTPPVKTVRSYNEDSDAVTIDKPRKLPKVKKQKQGIYKGRLQPASERAIQRITFDDGTRPTKALRERKYLYSMDRLNF